MSAPRHETRKRSCTNIILEDLFYYFRDDAVDANAAARHHPVRATRKQTTTPAFMNRLPERLAIASWRRASPRRLLSFQPPSAERRAAPGSAPERPRPPGALPLRSPQGSPSHSHSHSRSRSRRGSGRARSSQRQLLRRARKAPAFRARHRRARRARARRGRAKAWRAFVSFFAAALAARRRLRGDHGSVDAHDPRARYARHAFVRESVRLELSVEAQTHVPPVLTQLCLVRALARAGR